MSKFAWVTLSTNDTYALGALVLAYSLKKVNSIYPMAIMVTPNVSHAMRDCLKHVYELIEEVNIMDSNDINNLALLQRPELGITFTKFHCWHLTQYEKCVFLDADTLVLQNCDELFEYEELSAASDVSWPDCFNSGVFVYQPNSITYENILKYAIDHGSFDGGDQGILNQYFNNFNNGSSTTSSNHGQWHRLPFLYNVAAYAAYCYLPAFKKFYNQIKILHFAGKQKPWLMSSHNIPMEYKHATDFIQFWWHLFNDHVYPQLNNHMNHRMMAHISSYIMQHQHHQHHHQEQQQQQHKKPKIYSQTHRVDEHDKYYRKSKKKKFVYQQEQQQQQLQQRSQQQQHYKHFRNDVITVKPTMQADQKPEIAESMAECSNSVIREISQINDKNISYRCLTTSASSNIISTSSTSTSSISTTTSASSSSSSSTILKYFHLSCEDEQLPKYGVIEETQNQSKMLNAISKRSQIEMEDDAKGANDANVTKKFNNNQNNNNHNNSNDHVNEDYKSEAGLAGRLTQLHLDDATCAIDESEESKQSKESVELDLMRRRQCWEAGHIDYTGADSFDNIWQHIQKTLQQQAKTNKTSTAASLI